MEIFNNYTSQASPWAAGLKQIQNPSKYLFSSQNYRLAYTISSSQGIRHHWRSFCILLIKKTSFHYYYHRVAKSVPTAGHRILLELILMKKKINYFKWQRNFFLWTPVRERAPVESVTYKQLHKYLTLSFPTQWNEKELKTVIPFTDYWLQRCWQSLQKVNKVTVCVTTFGQTMIALTFPVSVFSYFLLSNAAFKLNDCFELKQIPL